MYVHLRDVGLEQIRAGMTWHYKEYQREQPTEDRLEVIRIGIRKASELEG